MASRVSKEITNKDDLNELYSLKEEDITFSYLVKLFGEINGKRKYNTFDTMNVPPNTYGPEGKKNKNTFKTTVGLWIFNKLFIEKDLFDLFHYINTTINKKLMGKLLNKMSYAILEDDITMDIEKRFLQKTQFTMRLVSIISYNDTENMLTSMNAINKEKKRILKQYEKELENGDELVMERIEKHMISYAKDLLKDDPAYDIYDSGMVNFDNNFKNMYIMKGMVKDPDPDKGFNFITSSYMEGIKKEEYPALAKSQAAGAYSRGKLTGMGGYLEKLYVAALQHIMLEKDGTDCGTKRHITVELTENNAKIYMYSYMIEGGRLVELTSKNMDKYIGKTVKFRFSSMCESKKGICSKCAGTLFYRLKIDKVGLACSMLPSKLKLINMKAFHDSQVNTTEMDPMSAFL